MGEAAVKDQPAAAVAGAPPVKLSALGEFCRRHDVLFPEAIWLLAHVVFDVLIVLAWVLADIPQAPKYLTVNLCSMTAILVLRPAMRKADGGILWILRHWYPVTFYGVFFIECGALVPALNPREYDAQVAALDARLFGTLGTAFMARIHHPALSEFLQFCYASYYFLPVVAGAQIMARRGTKPLADGIAMISIAFYGSYAGYFLCPVVGPRFFPPYHDGLAGLWTFDAIRTFLAVSEGKMHDCMPSGHTAITLLTMIFAWRTHRPTFWVLLPFASGLVLSTVYLRYHYVIDLAAAVPLTFLALWGGHALVRAWDRLRGDPGAPTLLAPARLDSPARETV